MQMFLMCFHGNLTKISLYDFFNFFLKSMNFFDFSIASTLLLCLTKPFGGLYSNIGICLRFLTNTMISLKFSKIKNYSILN